eukprot:15807-Chlamydomonas_euryale.AAC.2
MPPSASGAQPSCRDPRGMPQTRTRLSREKPPEARQHLGCLPSTLPQSAGAALPAHVLQASLSLPLPPPPPGSTQLHWATRRILGGQGLAGLRLARLICA